VQTTQTADEEKRQGMEEVEVKPTMNPKL